MQLPQYTLELHNLRMHDSMPHRLTMKISILNDLGTFYEDTEVKFHTGCHSHCARCSSMTPTTCLSCKSGS